MHSRHRDGVWHLARSGWVQPLPLSARRHWGRRTPGTREKKTISLAPLALFIVLLYVQSCTIPHMWIPPVCGEIVFSATGSIIPTHANIHVTHPARIACLAAAAQLERAAAIYIEVSGSGHSQSSPHSHQPLFDRALRCVVLLRPDVFFFMIWICVDVSLCFQD